MPIVKYKRRRSSLDPNAGLPPSKSTKPLDTSETILGSGMTSEEKIALEKLFDEMVKCKR
jgi:hypothetical protein